jgi:C1A family cysteine protease
MKRYLILLVCLSLFVSLAAAQSREAVALQEILKATNATWSAGDTSFSQLNAIEQEKLFGLLPGIWNPARLPMPTVATLSVRARGHEAGHTKIKDQGQCGSCYSFGASATYEGWKLLKDGETLDLSEQYFMMKAKEIGPYGGCSGWYLDTSMNLLRDNGVADEKDCKYKAAEEACGPEAQPTYKIGAYAVTTDLDTIKKALHENGPVYVGFAVYSDFSYYKEGVYRFSSGYLRGYHAVCIVGYDDDLQCFKVKNSWGTGWGEKGYFRIGYDQMTNSVQFGTCFGGSFYITE